VLTRTRGRGGRILREERAHAAGTDAKTPLVVLQDRHTASAAELLSVALQETGRAQVVGERSYGKGTVQEVMGLEDGSVLTLTIARYFSPKDRAIEKVGVEPDVHHVLPKGSEDAAGLEVALKSLGLQALSR
jgi:carboxyl-terminal processing protease